MTYRELIAELQKLTPEQLESEVICETDEYVYSGITLHVFEEDYVDPDEYGECSPISMYTKEELEGVPVKIKKGTVRLAVDY